jgi:hypothetical protein
MIYDSYTNGRTLGVDEYSILVSNLRSGENMRDVGQYEIVQVYIITTRVSG